VLRADHGGETQADVPTQIHSRGEKAAKVFTVRHRICTFRANAQGKPRLEASAPFKSTKTRLVLMP